MLTKSSIRRAAAALGGAALAALVLAGPASAHVTVNPAQTPGGGYTKLSFQVPTESDTASTTRLQVALPTDHPLALVSVRPVPGWTAKVTMTKLAKPLTTDDGQVTEAASMITWTSTPAAVIKPGQFQEFDISAGPLPASGTLTFKALQTYSDGSVVRWIDLTKPGQPEPEHPAPVLTLTKATDTGSASTSGTKTSDKSDSGSDAVPVSLSVIALVAALAALAAALLRKRS